MSAWAALRPGTRLLVLTLAGLVAAGVGILGWQALRPAEPAPVAAQAPAAAVQEAAPTVEIAAATPVEEPVPAPPGPALPKIDTWRVATDGEALVAGRATPGARVEVIVDDRPVAEGMALATGEFVMQFTLAPNPAASLLWLSMTPPDGVAVASPEIVALAPIKGPEPATQPDVTALAGDAAEPPPASAAETAPTALLVTDEGAVVLQGDAPADVGPAAQVMIDAITYTSAGAVQVGGRGAGGAVLRLYLDNAETASLTVPEDGRWLVTLGDIAPGIYMLRVDQLTADGTVSSRFETPFKRETLDDLALAAGTDGAGAPRVAAVSVPDATADEAAPAPALAPAPAGLPADPGGEADAAESAPVVASGQAPVPEVSPEAGLPVSITVQPGFTLWGIAQERLGDGVLYVQVLDMNREKIKDPDLIYPGQVFTIPSANP